MPRRKSSRWGDVEEPVIDVRMHDETLVYRQSTSVLPARPLGAPLLEELAGVPVKKEKEEEESTTSLPSECISNIDRLADESRSQTPVVDANGESTPKTNLLLARVKKEPLAYNSLPSSSGDPASLQSTSSLHQPDLSNSVDSNYDPGGWNGVAAINDIALLSSPAARSRSSSTETVLADESQQVPFENFSMSPLNCRNSKVLIKKEPTETLSPESKKRPPEEIPMENVKRVKTEISNESSEIERDSVSHSTLSGEEPQNLSNETLQSNKNFSAEWNKSIQTSRIQPFGEKANQPLFPFTSAPTSQKVFKLFRYKNLISKVNAIEISESLSFLKNTYPHTKTFSLFNNKELLQKEPVEVHPQIVKLNTTESILSEYGSIFSKENLKKIIETTSLHNPMSSALQQKEGNIATRKETVLAPSAVSTSFKTTDENQTVTPGVACVPNIKTESISPGKEIPPTFYSSGSVSKRSVSETNQNVKKIKIDPVSPVKQNDLAKQNFCVQTDERCAVNQATSSVTPNMINTPRRVTTTIENNLQNRIPVINQFHKTDGSNKGKPSKLNCNREREANFSNNTAFACNVSDHQNDSLSRTSNNTENEATKTNITTGTIKKIFINPLDPRLNKNNNLNHASSNLIPNRIIADPNTSSSSENTGNDHTIKYSNRSQVSVNPQIPERLLQDPHFLRSLDAILKNPAAVNIENSMSKNIPADALTPHLRESKMVSSDIKSPESQKHLKVSHPLQNSEKLKQTASHNPQLSGVKSRVQKISDPPNRNQTSSSVFHPDDIGNKFIETQNLPPIILKWHVEWLETQKRDHLCPAIRSRYPRVKESYRDVLDYYNTYLPLHLLNIWLKFFHCWKTTNVICVGVFGSNYDKQNLVINKCLILLSPDMKSPKEDDILICKLKNRSGSVVREIFGRVLKTFVTPCNARPGWWNMELDIESSDSFGVSPNTSVEFRILINLRIPLIQNDALKFMSTHLRPLILNPKERGLKYQSVTVQPFSSSKITSNVSIIVRSVQQNQVTVVRTPSLDDSTLALKNALQSLAYVQKTPQLVCFKDESAFFCLAECLKKMQLSLILCVKEDEITQPYQKDLVGLEKFLVTKQDLVAAFHPRCIVLTLVSAAFFGGLEARLQSTSTPITCLFHEAQNFVETESALFLHYNVQKLVMLGDIKRKTELPSIMYRFRFDMSLFERFL